MKIKYILALMITTFGINASVHAMESDRQNDDIKKLFQERAEKEAAREAKEKENDSSSYADPASPSTSDFEEDGSQDSKCGICLELVEDRESVLTPCCKQNIHNDCRNELLRPREIEYETADENGGVIITRDPLKNDKRCPFCREEVSVLDFHPAKSNCNIPQEEPMIEIEEDDPNSETRLAKLTPGQWQLARELARINGIELGDYLAVLLYERDQDLGHRIEMLHAEVSRRPIDPRPSRSVCPFGQCSFYGSALAVALAALAFGISYF